MKMHPPDDRDARQGISAVLMSAAGLDSTVLDLAAVLEGLVSNQFEIIVVSNRDQAVEFNDLRARAPGLPLRAVEGDSLAAGCDVARYGLIFLSATNGQFDVRQLNHLLEEIDRGADVAAGYRPRASDGIVRRLHRWGWPIDLDCACNLFRRAIWLALGSNVSLHTRAECADFLSKIRRSGYRVAEVPVRQRRATAAASAA
jgi:hypothetical protein